MKKETKASLIRFVLVLLAFLTFCLIQTVRMEQSSIYAQESMQYSSSDVIDEGILLNSFTFWDHLKIGLMAYINPHASTEKSLIFVYEFTDEEFREALSNIPESLERQLIIGLAETNADESGLIWTPNDRNSINFENNNNNISQFYASNLPINGRDQFETYWIPYAEFREKFRDQAETAEVGQMESNLAELN